MKKKPKTPQDVYKRQQLMNHVKAAYLDLYSSDLDKLVQELVSDGSVRKQGNQYYVKK